MNRLLAWVTTMDDRMNSIAVKEFRQAVQGRWVVATLMLFLLINLLILGGNLMLASPLSDVGLHQGRDIFQWLIAILQVTCIAFVPIYCGLRLSLERSDANIDLFFVTTITPGAIVRGKYLTAMAMTLLFYSAAMPFMILTYLLRGIDLPTIFYMLAAGFIFCAMANAVGVFVGCIPGTWFQRGLAALGTLVFLAYLGGASIALIESTVYFGVGFMSSMTSWAIAGTWLLGELMLIGLLYVLAVALLSPAPSNRMFVPRLYMTSCWFVGGLVALLWAVNGRTVEPVMGWMIVGGVAFSILMVAALGERDAWSARVRRMVPRNPLLRTMAFVLYTGAAGGIAWSVLMFAATVALAGLFFSKPGYRGRSDCGEACTNLVVVFGYILCYCLTTAALRPNILRSVKSINLPGIAGLLGTIAYLAPLLAVFFSVRDWEKLLPWFLLGSPLVLTSSNHAAIEMAYRTLAMWLVLGALASSPWALAQWRRFTPYQTVAVEEATS